MHNDQRPEKSYRHIESGDHFRQGECPVANQKYTCCNMLLDDHSLITD